MIDFDALKNWWARLVPLGEFPALDVPGVEPTRPGSTGHPDLIDRIDKVIGRHRLAATPLSWPSWACRCGKTFDCLAAHRRHVAQLVAEEITAT